MYLQNVEDGSTCTFRDITVIYQRAQWHWWDGGRIVSFRSLITRKSLVNVTVKNVFVEDPLPVFPPFYGRMVSTGDKNRNITIKNVVFENIHQEFDGVSTKLDDKKGKPRNTLTGLNETKKIENITFKNCYFNGKTLTSFKDGNF